MFIDETTITVQAGGGGNGCYAHQRDKRHPRGRPYGGDGGRGGHVYVQASSQIQTLRDVSYRRTYKAKRGAHGKGSTKTGKNGEDAIITVPAGTVVHDSESGRILFDCLRNGERFIAARGGRGGRGNYSLATPKNPDPEECEPGQPGETRRLRLVLKMLADIGLVGRPNAGKSTFLSRVSNARPRIADYPFTTTEPHLGIAHVPHGYRSLVVADIPGLIEDSHLGKGMGIRFLKHIERTKALAILVPATSDAPGSEVQVLEEELRSYSPLLAGKPRRYILTKADLAADRPPANLPKGWLWVSSATGENLDTVLHALSELCKQEEHDEPGECPEP